jgi:hypothetical protein
LRGHVDTQGGELRAELEKIIARRRRAKAAKANGSDQGLTSREASPLLLPSPANGNGHAQ